MGFPCINGNRSDTLFCRIQGIGSPLSALYFTLVVVECEQRTHNIVWE
uniref:Uncharacterized protein n=1 Tax=Rhizophora mucronata TaxID=61149 RepID=A0A2P2NQC7_RHIMU